MRKVKTALFTVLLSLSLAVPMTAYAGTWVQTPNGWQVQSDDGTYLINQWYQSPESGLWYYIGADGYMLTNTITPDGYQVDQNGVWIQAPEPEVPSTESNDEEISAEEQAEWEAYLKEIKENSKKASGTDHSGETDVQYGYDSSGEINLNGGM